MTTIDLSTLSRAELLKLSKKLDEDIAAKRTEELKVLADGFIKKIQAAGFSAAEGLQALQPYVASRAARKPKVPGRTVVMYRDPANPENTWSGRGLPARWLANYEAQGRSRDEFKTVQS